MIKKRGPLAVEGVTTADGRHIAFNALTWDEPLPLYARGGLHAPTERTLIGMVTDIERQGSVIVGTFESNRDFDEAAIIDIDLTQFGMTEDGQLMLVTSGRMRGICTSGGWPWPAYPQTFTTVED